MLFRSRFISSTLAGLLFLNSGFLSDIALASTTRSRPSKTTLAPPSLASAFLPALPPLRAVGSLSPNIAPRHLSADTLITNVGRRYGALSFRSNARPFAAGPLVIHVQDIHRNPQAQRQIADF